MFRLETFGGLSLTDGAGVPVTTQRRRLALLALLAGAGDRGLSRDKILAYLWSEKPTDSARHALEQLVYAMRKDGGSELVTGRNPLQLNRAIVRTDLDDFEAAIAGGAPAVAVQAYRGAFLDGFYLHDAEEFERWVESERARLALAYRAALESCARAAAARGDHAASVESRRKLAAQDPLDGAAALALMRAFVSVGDDAAALSHARVHQQLLADQLGIAPNPSLAQFVDELRRKREVASPEVATSRRAPSRASEAEARIPTDHLAGPSASHGWRSALLGGIGVLGLAVLVAAVWRDQMTGLADGSPASSAPRIVVLPFGVASADSSVVHLREGMVHLLAQRLTGEGGPTATDPAEAIRLATDLAPRNSPITTEDAFRVAEKMSAEEVLFGEIVAGARGSVVLSGAISSVPNRLARSRASVEGSADSLPRLADRLVADLLAQRAGEPESRRSALRDARLPAVRAFLAGRAAQRRGDDDAAIAAFSRALAADSTLGLAGLELASSMGWLFRWTVRLNSTISGGVRLGSGVRMTGDEETWIRAVDLAWKGRERMSAGDLAYLSALRGRHYPGASSAREALADWESVVRLEPKRAEVWTRLGEVLLQQGFALGLNDAHVRATALLQQARELDPDYMRPVAWLVELAALSGNTAEVRRLAAVYLSHDSVSRNADFLRWRVAAAVQDVRALASLRERFDSLDSQTLERIQWSSQVNGVTLEDAERAMSILVRRAGERRERWISLWLAKLLALNSGRPHAALLLAEAKRQVEPDSGLFRWYNVLHALYWDGDSVAGADGARLLERDASSAIASGGAQIGTRSAHQELFSAAQWRLWRGDTSGVTQTIRSIRRFSLRYRDSPLAESADVLDAILAAVSHRADAPALLERVDSLALQGCCNRPHYIGLVVARLRERAGDRAGALRAIRRGRWFHPPEYLSSFLREEGRLAALTGDRQGAIDAYRHYLALRENPEPALRPERDRIRAELATLEAQTPER